MNFLLAFSISLIGLVFLLINTVLFTKNKTVRKKVSKVLIIYLIALLCVETICHVVGFLKPGSNFFLSHFYFYFQYVLLSYLYYRIIEDKFMKKMIVVLTILFHILLAYTYISDPSIFWRFNEIEILSTSFLLVFYAVMFIVLNMHREHKYFSFSLGLIMYLLCSISIFMTGNTELVIIKDPFIDVWVLNSLFYIMYQFMIFKEYRQLSSNERTEIVLNSNS